ncbi:MAG: S1 RNA-binding domain-containing protein [Patescibacteria group bacterium]
MPKVTFDPSSVMEDLLAQGPQYKTFHPGILVECEIIDIIGTKILVDIEGFAIGTISGKEAHDNEGALKDLVPGKIISAYIIEPENEDGYYVLSLRKASQERTWTNFIKAYETGEVISVTVSEANKGGLLILMEGIKGFIPVSQLAPLHYPRVDGANISEILSRLQRLVGLKMNVKIINVDQVGGKLILSEKSALEDQRSKTLKTLQIGSVVHGVISGIVKFGIFVAFDGLEGLVHISEIEWGHVKDSSTYGKVGNPVDVQIIGIENDKISLSMKRLTPDPWQQAADKYKVGKVVKGKIDRITQFGVFMKIEDDINGLIHLSELSHEPVKDPYKILKIGQEVEAKIITIDAQEHRIGLSLKALMEPPKEDEKEANKEEKDEETEEVKEKKEKKKKVEKAEKAE